MSTIVKEEKAHKLSDLINYYETCNRAESKSLRTITWYSANLASFLAYLKSRHLPDSVEDIDIKLLRDYVLYLMKRRRFENHPYTSPSTEPLSSSTIHGHVRTLRAFFNWLAREGFIGSSTAKELRPPKVVQKVVSTLSDEEILSVLRMFSPGNNSEMRNQTIFMVLLDTGLRIGELVSLQMDNANMTEGLLKVMGKGKKERIVPVGNKAQKALQRYIFRNRPNPAHSGIENVFLSVHGTPLTENSVKLMFARLARRSGVSRLHAHLCRHTFATRFLINGGDVFTLHQILGHSTL